MNAYERSSASARDARLRVNLVGMISGQGGIARYVNELRVHLFDSVTYEPCEVTAAAFGGVPLLRQLPLAVRGLDPISPVHFPQIVGCGALWFRRLPPSVVTVHDLGFVVWPDEARMFSPMARFFLRLAFEGLRRADRLIAVSHATMETLALRLGIPRERIVCVPQGVDHQTFWPRPEARREAERRLGVGDWDRGKTLLMVGSELPRKNLPALLEALAVFRQRGQRVRLVKVGGAGGPHFRAATLDLAEGMGVRDALHIVEAVSDDDLAFLYSAADAYICVSHVEGFSLPTLEALACGALVAVADSGALPEVVGDGGIVLRRAGGEQIVQALEAVWADGGLGAELRRRALRQAARFSWQRTALETLAVYQELSAAR